MTLRRLMLLVFAAVIVSAGAPPSLGEDAGPLPPFQAYVDMKTFMEHVLTPAAAVNLEGQRHSDRRKGRARSVAQIGG